VKYSLADQRNTVRKEGLEIAPLGETLPKKHHCDFTLKDV